MYLTSLFAPLISSHLVLTYLHASCFICISIFYVYVVSSLNIFPYLLFTSNVLLHINLSQSFYICQSYPYFCASLPCITCLASYHFFTIALLFFSHPLHPTSLILLLCPVFSNFHLSVSCFIFNLHLVLSSPIFT